jgi:hypothetical protein
MKTRGALILIVLVPRVAMALTDAPLFSQLRQDKTTVCTDEDFRVDVTPLASDPRLAVFVGGELGNPGVVSIGVPGSYTIPVQATLQDAVQRGGVPITVVDCPGRPLLRIRSLMPPSSLYKDTAIFQADTSLEMAHHSFSWDFGDGGVDARKGVDVIQHSYALRPQATRYSTFVVTLTVRYVPLLSTIPPYVVARARHTVSFVNPQYLAKESGRTSVPVDVKWLPRDPAAPDNEKRVVRIKNIHAAAVTLTRASVSARLCGTGEVQTLADRPLSYFFGAAAPAVIPAGGVWTQTLGLKGSDFKDKVCSVDVTLKGNVGAQKDIPSLGRFTFDTERHLQWRLAATAAPPALRGATPAPAPRILQDIVISDPETRRKLRQAMKLVGRNQITLYDIVRLRAEGRIDDVGLP